MRRDRRHVRPEDPSKVTDLPDDPFFPGQGQARFHRVSRAACKILAGQEIQVRVDETAGAAAADVCHALVSNRCSATTSACACRWGRSRSSAGFLAEARFALANARKQLEADMIEAVTVKEAMARDRLQR